MNAYTLEKIKSNGEVVLLLGVRKAESTYRANNIRSREIEGKILVPHTDIEGAHVYNPLTEIPNELVWKFLLKDDSRTPWGSDNKYLFSLYQGENLGEEQSVIGEIDKDKIPVTGHSRFGCWICTVVKDDKSMNQLIKNGISWMQPLLDFRNRLAENRNKSENRCSTRRNGQLAVDENGHNMGNYTMEYRIQILFDHQYCQEKNRCFLCFLVSSNIQAVHCQLKRIRTEQQDLILQSLKDFLL